VMEQKLLIVDDQNDLRRMLRIVLGYGKYIMFEASTGLEALAIAEREHPDVVLLDVMMPGGMHGFEVCSRIRQIAYAVENPPYIALLTALERPEDIASGQAVGADIYIIKPYSPVRLVEIIESRLRSGKAIPVVRLCD
jgi:two-component system phosphate regulon response regulator PhoB